MADISKIKTLNGTIYDLKDAVARKVHDPDPLMTKTYTDVIATANDQNGAGFFYMKVRGDTYNSNWHVKTRVKATVPGNVNYNTDTTFDIFGYANTYSWYSCVNRIRSTSYRPIYYNSLFRVSETGYNNSCGAWIGFSLFYSTNPTTTSLKREVTVELLAYENCNIEFQDSLITPTNIPNRAAHKNYYVSTNTGYDNFDACNYGLKQSGDANTTSISNLLRNNGSYVADSAIYRYQLLFEVDENTLTPLTNANNVIATTKTMLTDVEFDPFKPIYYYSSTTTVAVNGAIGAGALFWSFNGIDLRYTFNCGTTLTAHKPFYLVVTPTNGGKCKLASATPWSHTLPNSNDGKWYILLGRTYSASNFVLYDEHPVFYHDGTGVKQIISADTIGDAATVNGHIVNKDVPANAVFTDTTYGAATTAAAGLMTAADKVKLDSIDVSSANSPILVIEVPSLSTLPYTVTSDKITANHYLLEATLSNPAAQTGDWTIDTASVTTGGVTTGTMTISGTISGQTDVTIALGRIDTTSSTMLVYDISEFSTLPQTVTDSRITAFHTVLHTELSNPAAQADDWTITTGTGTMQITGNMAASQSTALRVILGTAGNI